MTSMPYMQYVIIVCIRWVQFIQHEFSMFRIMLDIECQDGLQTNNKRL